MEDLKMALSDGSEIAIVGFALPLTVTVNCGSMQEMVEIWDKLHTKDAMEQVTIVRDGMVSSVYHGVEVDGSQIVENGDGTLTVHFYMHDNGAGQASVDDGYVQAAKILLGEEV